MKHKTWNIKHKKKNPSSATCFMFHVSSRRGGFSLVELLVAVMIITVVSSIAIAGQNRFGSQILLTNLAYDIALSIRESQSFSLNTKESVLGPTDPGDFSVGYGISLQKNPSGNPITSYITFVDRNVDNTDVKKNKSYDSDGINACSLECLKTYELGGGNIIEKFCVTNLLGKKCSDEIGGPSRVDIVFERSEADASIKSGENSYVKADIHILSPQNLTKVVSVTVTGQISVQ